MGLFSPPSAPTPPPPPPLPPAANPQTQASGQVQQTAQRAKQNAAMAAGAGFNGTDITKPGGTSTGAGPTAKAALLGGTS